MRVTRAYQVTVHYMDLKGKEHTLSLEGPMAELVQHEVDHLDGILAVDRAAGRSTRSRMPLPSGRKSTRRASAATPERPSRANCPDDGRSVTLAR